MGNAELNWQHEARQTRKLKACKMKIIILLLLIIFSYSCNRYSTLPISSTQFSHIDFGYIKYNPATGIMEAVCKNEKMLDTKVTEITFYREGVKTNGMYGCYKTIKMDTQQVLKRFKYGLKLDLAEDFKDVNEIDVHLNTDETKYYSYQLNLKKEYLSKDTILIFKFLDYYQLQKK